MYHTRLEQNMAPLTKRLYELYGEHWDFYNILSRLEKIMKKASQMRTKDLYLKKADEEAQKSIESKESQPWYLNQETVGMMLYVDLFAENLRGKKKQDRKLYQVVLFFV